MIIDKLLLAVFNNLSILFYYFEYKLDWCKKKEIFKYKLIQYT